MQRCFDLAQLAGKNVKSNPQVGAVIVYNDKIIGEGYHKVFGDHHAEINAFNSVKDKDKHLLKDSTLYISLEPCCISRKTPPCTDAIIQSGIKEVVYSVEDPNADIAGRSEKLLAEHNINVTKGILSRKGAQLILPFKANLKVRPYVILKFAQSSDAYIGKRGKRVIISNEYSQILNHKWRSEVDGILIGYQTALADDPQLNNRLWTGDTPLRIVLDPKDELSDNIKLRADDLSTLFVNDEVKKTLTNAHKELINIAPTENFISDLLEMLYKKSVYSLIVEGGAKTIRKFIEANLWDEARVITSNTPLRSGIKAPYITGIPISKYSILNDEVTHVLNKQL
ncbi:bifunctional diaminohydroxyphosphoribosylaminopyrimidine deaminase/5-amino-6-(5-phosphoribosylamino)uracil reductase RibD [Saprospiraceae bacterium]|nr:bifunctional diaminohydroxyphosphoribosylaminopyrimidine deaminase/5-amino-6-(5-phosphoribosylamino)uracil reductase RibD [Saprospiraceae bacterium]